MLQLTSDTFRLFSLITTLSLACLAAGCHHGGGNQPNESKGSSHSASSAGNDFEGVIAMKMTGEEEKAMEMSYFIKGRHTRVDTNMGSDPEGQAVMLFDLDGAKLTTLMPARKSYITMDLKQAAEGIKEAARGMTNSKTEEDMKFPKLTATGKQETIAGYNCEHWLMGEKQNVAHYLD